MSIKINDINDLKLNNIHIKFLSDKGTIVLLHVKSNEIKQFEENYCIRTYNVIDDNVYIFMNDKDLYSHFLLNYEYIFINNKKCDPVSIKTNFNDITEIVL